ncbi:MAG: hypothetical protein OXU63_03505 [Acidobacteriota bacterium]|nr:hypothetical protein [Acidobacteriota bacterium]
MGHRSGQILYDLYAARELVRHMEDAGILITGKESMPTWDGRPLDLPYVVECLVEAATSSGGGRGGGAADVAGGVVALGRECVS